MTVESKESVLSRWSRLKSEAGSDAEPTGHGDQALPAEQGEAEASLKEAQEKPILTDADMPDVESLTEDSDFSGFMSEGVSDELRNLALRKLFRAPVFNIRDGLDEYDEDYTTFEKLGDIVTADMKHQIEVQEQKLREKLAAESETEALEEAEIDAMEEEIEDDEADDETAETTLAAANPELTNGQKYDNEQ